MRKNDSLYQQLFAELPKHRIYFDYEMRSFSTFNVGGKADILFLPESISEIKEALAICRNNSIPFQVLGRGSNILISDRGIRGLTIYLGRNFIRVSHEDNHIRAQAGASLAAVTALAAKNNLTGLEFSVGIPGSIGGAVLMNASAYDSEIKNVVISSSYLTPQDEIITLNGDEHQFDYRTSIYQKIPGIILEADFALKEGKRLEIYEKIQEFQIKRRESQPIDKYSAGSAFKRPTDNYASKLIADAGLKGYRAMNTGVSEKHAGFIINYGGASASDINRVFAHVKSVVETKFGISLQPEVKWIGDWPEEEIQWKCLQ
ncbi:MAG TPA: UDP-N-acetylmuramate dehydrogenase [Clostridiaceae bacterium]|jgi:UDP-N-acetylmuramate dehydrogenase|nr:UDP-N-acetylmuramate dehydrogenase [Clostridiaceae bacterium]